MTNDSLIDSVARAICNADIDPHTTWDSYKQMAKAAIAAMGDASACKDEGDTAQATLITSPVVSSEISVVGCAVNDAELKRLGKESLKGLMALYAQCPDEVVKDVHGRVGAYIDALNARIATREREVINPDFILATDGTKILIDPEDYPLLSRHNWYINYSSKRPYAITKLKTDQSRIWRCIFMHHLILGSSSQTDHRDTNSLNNRKLNLRPATRSENGANSRKMPLRNGKPCASQYKGVTWSKQSNKWRAGITKDRKKYNLGEYADETKAAQAYNEKALELFGEYAALNKINSAGIEGGES